jgi:hypothetical protein
MRTHRLRKLLNHLGRNSFKKQNKNHRVIRCEVDIKQTIQPSFLAYATIGISVYSFMITVIYFNSPNIIEVPIVSDLPLSIAVEVFLEVDEKVLIEIKKQSLWESIKLHSSTIIIVLVSIVLIATFGFPGAGDFVPDNQGINPGINPGIPPVEADLLADFVWPDFVWLVDG